MLTRFSRLFLVAALVLFSSAYAMGLSKSFTGFVTSVSSQTTFDVGARHVICDSHTKREGEIRSSRTGTYLIQIRVGLRVHVEGRFDRAKGYFRATLVRALPGTAISPYGLAMSGSGIIQQAPQWDRRRLSNGQEGVGTLWVSGYPLQITAKTQLIEKSGAAFLRKDIRPNLQAKFEGARFPDGLLVAQQITFATVPVQKIRAYRKKSEPSVVEPDYLHGVPGKLNGGILDAQEILPDKSVQDYVQRVGDSLIPQYQKDMRPGDPAKVDFRFYVTQPPKQLRHDVNEIVVYPCGVIVLPDKILASITNEAQLAAVLSVGVALVLDNPFYRSRKRLDTQYAIQDASALAGSPLIFVVNAMILRGLMLRIFEEAGREGTAYMLRAGYDIREAPSATEPMLNLRIGNPWKRRDYPTVLTRNLMENLRLDYADVNYSSLKTDQEAYQQMVKELRRDDPTLPKAKNRK